MTTSMVGAALSVVGAALVPFKDSVLEKWAASVKLGANVNDLKLELLSVRALLEHTAGREIAENSALKELLVILQDLTYDADDVLDELDYFRIQDDLDGTSEAAAEHAKGCACDLALHVHHTARDVAKQICCLPAAAAAATLGHMLKARISNRDSSSEMHTNQLANREINDTSTRSIHAVGLFFEL